MADRRFQVGSFAVIFSLLMSAFNAVFKKRTRYYKASFKKLKLTSFARNEDNKNDSVEAHQNQDGSGQDQGELQRCGTTLICREESNGGRMEGDYKRL